MPFGLASIWREDKWKRTDPQKVNSFSGDNNSEPTSLLLMRSSPTPSPPTSVFTLSSSLYAGGSASAAANNKNEWANELQPILATPGAGRCSLGVEDWETMLSAGDIDEASLLGLKHLLHSNSSLGIVDQGSVLDPLCHMAQSSASIYPSSSEFHANVKIGQLPMTVDTTVDSCGVGNGNDVQASNLNHLVFQSQSQPLMNQQQDLLIPHQLPYHHHQEHHVLLMPPLKRHNTASSYNQLNMVQDVVGFGTNTDFEVLLQQFQQQPSLGAAKQEVHGELEETAHNVIDQLYKAAELVETANYSHAQVILARLNHQLSPVGKPYSRAAYYFKEALQSLLLYSGAPTGTRTPTAFDVIFKMGAYKAFSEISPLLQFANFTANQAFLEALDPSRTIHIVDFDIGFGAQWASFLQELPSTTRGVGVGAVKITAITSPSTHHPIEVALMHDTLSQLLQDLGLRFELQVLNFDSLDLQDSVYSHTFRPDEAVAVNLPIWSCADQSARLPSVIRFIKRLSPCIVVCLDSAYTARTELPFPQHVLHTLHSFCNLLESVEAARVSDSDTEGVSRIERFLFLPRIETALLGHLCSRGGTQPWRNMLASAGLTPVPFSSFAEAQAECVVKRTETIMRGFQLVKRPASLILSWHHHHLLSVSAWRF